MGRFSVAVARKVTIFPRGRICWKTGLKVVSVGAAVAVQARGLVRTTADVLRGKQAGKPETVSNLGIQFEHRETDGSSSRCIVHTGKLQGLCFRANLSDVPKT